MSNKLKSINLQVYIMLIAIVVIMIFFTLLTEGAYLSARNISNLLRQTSITGILAIGMVFVIISAEIDLSVGSLMGLLGGFAAISNVWWGWPLPLTILVTLILGTLLGTWNGWWVAYRKVPSFIVTLAGMLAFRGMLIGITNGTTVSPISADMTSIGQGYLSDVVGMILGMVAVCCFILWGNYQRTARNRLSGIGVEKVKLLIFSINGLMVAIAGLILSARLGAGAPSAGQNAELDAIAACVIGGASLAGGIGSVYGVVIGAFIIALLDNGMSMLDVPTFWQYIVKGSILLLAVWADTMSKKKM